MKTNHPLSSLHPSRILLTLLLSACFFWGLVASALAQVPGVPFNGTGTIDAGGGVIDGANSTGFFLQSGNLTIENATIQNFLTRGGNGSGGGAGLGGVLFVNDGATATINDVTFQTNTVIGGQAGFGEKGGILNNMALLIGAGGADGVDGSGIVFGPDGNGGNGRTGLNGANSTTGFGGNGGNGNTGGSGADAVLFQRSLLAFEVAKATSELADANAALAAANTPSGVPPLTNPAEQAAAALAVATASSNLTQASTDLGIFEAQVGVGFMGNGGEGGGGGAGGEGGFGLGGGAAGSGGNGGNAESNSGAAGGVGGDGGIGGNGGFGGGGGRGGIAGDGGSGGTFGNGQPGGAGNPGDGGFGGFGAGDGSVGSDTNGLVGEGGSGYGGAIFVRDGGSLTVTGNTTFSGNNAEGGTSTNFGQSGNGAGTDLFIMAGADVTLAPGEGNTIEFKGTIADDSYASIGEKASVQTGEGAEINVEEGTVIFKGENTYTGQTNIKEGAVLQAVDGYSIHENSNINLEGGTIQSSGELSRHLGTQSNRIQTNGDAGFAAAGDDLTVEINSGAPLTIGQANFLQAGDKLLFGSDTATHDVTFKNSIDLDGETLTILVDSQSAILEGVLSNGQLDVNDADNDGTLVLDNDNTFTGGTTINNGTLKITENGSLVATGSVALGADAKFDLSEAGDQEIGDLSGGGEVMLGDNQLTINQDGNTVFSGILSDNGTEGPDGSEFIKKGTGTFQMTGDSTAVGRFVVEEGTVDLDGSLANRDVEVNALATLDSQNGGLSEEATLTNDGTTNIGATDDTVKTFNNTGTLNGTGTLTAETYNLDDGSETNANLGAGTVNANGNVAVNGTSDADNFNVESGTTTLGSAERLANSVVLDVDGTLVLGGNETIGTLNGSNTGEVDMSNGDLTLNGGDFAGVISSTDDSSVLNKNSTDKLTLSGNSTYKGETNINAGTVDLTGSLASQQVDVAANAKLNSTNGGLAADATLNNDGTTNLGSVDDTIQTLNNTGVLNGTATLTAATYNLNNNSEVNANLGEGVLNANGNVALNGTAGANTVNIQTGNTTLGSAERLDDGAVVTVSGPAKLLLGGDEKIGQLLGAGEVTLDQGSLTVSSGNFSGALTQMAPGNDDEGLNKVDGGTLTLSGTNTFTGPTNVQEGTLVLDGAGTLESKEVNVSNGATFDNNSGGLKDNAIANVDGTMNIGANEKVAELNGGGTGVVNLAGGDLEVSSGDFAGNIQGANNRTLTKVGNDELNLTGNNDFTGTTDIQEGTVNLTGSLDSEVVNVAMGAQLNSPNGGLAANATLNNNGTTDIGNTDDTIATLNNTGTLNGTATLTANTYNLNDGSIINANLGEGVLNSDGSVLLNGTSDANTVNVLSGLLTLGGPERLDDNAAVNLITGDLLLGGKETIGSLTGSGNLDAAGFELVVGDLTNFTGIIDAGTVPGMAAPPITISGNTTLNGTINSDTIVIDSDNFIVGPTGNLTSSRIEVRPSSMLSIDQGIVSTDFLGLDAGSTLNIIDGQNLSYKELNGGVEVDANGNLITAFIDTNGTTFVNPEGSTLSGFLTFSDGLRNEGVLALGASPGLTFINTNYTETNVLEIEIENTTPITGHDQVQVGGTVTAAPTSTLVVQSFNGATPTRGQVYQIISDTSGNPIAISGNFNRVLYDADGAGGPMAGQANAAAVLDMATGQLITTGLNQSNSTFSDLGKTANQEMVAAALFASAEQESGGANQINTTQEYGQAASAILLGTTPQELNKLSPEFFDSMRTYSTADDEARFQRIFNRIEARRLGPGGDTIVQSDAPQGSGWGESTVQIYAGGDGTFGNFDNSENDGNYNFISGTGFVGADFAITPNIYLGAVASGNGGNIDATFGSVDVVGWNATAYAIINPIDNLNVILAGGGGTYSYETSRSTVLGNADGNTDATTYGGFAGVQYAIPLNGGFEIVPFANGVFTNYNRDGFTESGPADALRVGSVNQSYIASNLGARFQWQTVLGNVLPFRIAASAAWNHQFSDTDGSFQNTFIGSGVGFTTNTPGTGQDGVEVGVGLLMGITENADLFLNYDGQFQTDGYQRNSVNAGVTIKL